MANYNILKAAIADYVKNRTGLATIDGDGLQQQLLAMVNSLGVGYQFIGVATTSTNPGTPDQKVFYLCESGTYVNFGNIEIPIGKMGILYYSTEWNSLTIDVPFISTEKISNTEDLPALKLNEIKYNLMDAEACGVVAFEKGKAFDNNSNANVISLGSWSLYVLKVRSPRIFYKKKPNLLFEFSDMPNLDGTSNASLLLGNFVSSFNDLNDLGFGEYEIINDGCKYIGIDFDIIANQNTVGLISQYESQKEIEQIAELTKHIASEYVVSNGMVLTDTPSATYMAYPGFSCVHNIKVIGKTFYVKTLPSHYFELTGEIQLGNNSAILLGYVVAPSWPYDEATGMYKYDNVDPNATYIAFDYTDETITKDDVGIVWGGQFDTVAQRNEAISRVVDMIPVIKKTPKNFVRVYHTDFSEQGQWVLNVLADSTYTGWVIDAQNKCAYPTHRGGYIASGQDTTEDTTRNLMSAIGRPKLYFYDQRKITFELDAYSDTVFNIHFYRGTTNKSGQRQSHYQIDFANKQLKLMKYIESSRCVTNTPLVTKTIPDTMIYSQSTPHKYAVNVIKNNFTFSVVLIDLVSAESVTVSYTGWGTGSNMYYNGFSWQSGTNAPKISNYSIWELEKPFLIELGDSITEGDGFDSNIYSPNTMNLYTRWAYRLNELLGNSYLCACTSATIENVIEQFENELQYIKPRYALITIGTNNPTMSAQDKYTYYQQMKTLCDTYGITLLLSHIPLSTWNNYRESALEANPYIDLIDCVHPKFDVAIAINNDISLGCDVNKTFDNGMHPNLVGADAFLARVKADCDFLFE